MKLLHHLLASAVCVAAFVATSTLSVSVQAIDVGYSGSGSDDGVSKLLRGFEESNDREFLSSLDESDDSSELNSDRSVEVGDSEEEGEAEFPTELAIDFARRLKGSTVSKTPTKPATPKSPPSKPTKPSGPKPTHRPKHAPTPTPTVTPASTPDTLTVTDTPTAN